MSKHISKKLGKHLFERAQRVEKLNVELQEEIEDLLYEVDELSVNLDLERSRRDYWHIAFLRKSGAVWEDHHGILDPEWLIVSREESN